MPAKIYSERKSGSTAKFFTLKIFCMAEGMASSLAALSSTSTGFDGGRSFYDQIMVLNSRHKWFMTEKLCYKVYVHSPFVDHHCLVLAETGGHCEPVTIELTINPIGTCTTDGENWQVTPRAQLYSSLDSSRPVSSLNCKGEICQSLEHLCEVAYRVLADMGSYNVAFNNCQHFCDKLLKEFGLPGHMTDTTTIGIAATIFGGAVGVFAAGYGLYKYFSNNENDNKEEKRKNLN